MQENKITLPSVDWSGQFQTCPRCLWAIPGSHNIVHRQRPLIGSCKKSPQQKLKMISIRECLRTISVSLAPGSVWLGSPLTMPGLSWRTAKYMTLVKITLCSWTVLTVCHSVESQLQCQLKYSNVSVPRFILRSPFLIFKSYNSSWQSATENPFRLKWEA